MRKIFLLLILVILIQSASAYTYLNIYLDETGKALFLGETNEEILVPNGVEIKNSRIIGETQELTGKQGELWSFLYSLEGADLNVILPEGAVIKDLDRGEISIDGNQISIYVKDEISIKYQIDKYNETYYWMFILGFLILIIIFYFLKRNMKKKKEDKIEKEKIVRQLLNKREKLILEKLSKTGKIKSSHLRRLCDIPKASFSRHLQELEKKKLIKKSGEGKNKFVELKR